MCKPNQLIKGGYGHGESIVLYPHGKNSISARKVSLKEKLVRAWALLTPTLFRLCIMDSCSRLYSSFLGYIGSQISVQCESKGIQTTLKSYCDAAIQCVLIGGDCYSTNQTETVSDYDMNSSESDNSTDSSDGINTDKLANK